MIGCYFALLGLVRRLVAQGLGLRDRVLGEPNSRRFCFEKQRGFKFIG